jgi:geranylgeranyl reductase family protein
MAAPADAVDVAVVGAGPAGAAAAINLARAGRAVVLVDKATFPRDKCCGDGLTTGALRLLEGLGLDPASVASWTPVDDVVVRSPSGREITFPLPRGQGTFAAVARRTDLDAALLDVARATGVEVLEGHACTGGRVGDDVGVVLDVDGIGELRAGHVVAADGMWSPLRKAFGVNDRGYLGEWHAFRQYFTGVGPRAATELMVWFEPDLLPGYVWSFPLAGGRANVGFGIQRGEQPTKTMKQQWPELLARTHIAEFLGAGATPEAPHKAWPIPARIERATLHAAGGRVLFAGDAAAAADPMTGEGIGQALLTGELAARAILGDGDVAGTYERSVRRELVADARMANALIRVLSSPLGARGAVRVAGATPWTRRNFARWLFEDYPRALVLTPGRWPEHSLTGTGAWVTSGHG